MIQKTKRTFNLKKRPSSRHDPNKNQQYILKSSQPSSSEGFRQEPISKIPEQSMVSIKQQPIVFSQGPQLFLSSALIKFQALIGKVDTQVVKVTNKGSTSIYFQWIKVPKSIMNADAVLDLTPKFNCLNQKNTIKPGEQIIFPFSFHSKIPGYFSQQFQLRCQPSPTKYIPLIKLIGNAYIIDKFNSTRIQLKENLNQQYITKCIKQIINDIIEEVKSPDQPAPDLSQQSVAQKQFQRVNSRLGSTYNPLIFSWWQQLYKDVAIVKSIESQQHWNLNLAELKALINSITNDAEKQFFNFRYNNYSYLSRNPQLHRSPLYKDIYSMIGEVACNIAGPHNDNIRKQLDMWQVQWRYPQQQQSPVEKKAKDDQLAKIKADWLKKAKKKKWTEDDEKNLINEYKNKLSSKINQEILNYFDNYQQKSAYIRTDQMMNKEALTNRYFRFLERLKTIKQVDIQNKKILLKFQLKTHENTESKIVEYYEYLQKRKQYQRKKQQQKKQAQKNKDKKKKNKNIIQLQQPVFNIDQIVNQDSLQTLIDIIRYTQQKSVKILTLLINFGPRLVIPDQTYTLKFLFDYLKTIDPLIQFVPHSELQNVRLKVEDDNYSDGTILLLQNCNYFVSQIGKQQIQQKVNELFASQIVQNIKILKSITDIYVNENKREQFSGISMFIEKQTVLGIDWWNNIAVALKAENATIILGGNLTPYKIQLIQRALWYSRQIVLVGQLGIAFMMVQQGIQQFLNIKLTINQIKAIKNIKNRINQQWQPQLPIHKRTPRPNVANIVIPIDIVVGKNQTDWTSSQNIITIQNLVQKSEQLQNCTILDLGQQTIQRIIQRIKPGKLFILETIHIRNDYYKSSEIIFKYLYKQKQNRRIRHQQQQKKGINYKDDVILIIVDDLNVLNDKIELVQKKKKVPKPVLQNDDEQYVQQQEQEQQEQQEQQQEKLKKKLKSLPDFQLKYSQYPIQVLSGKFSTALSKVSRYARSQLD